MIVGAQGLQLNKYEIDALVAFAGKELIYSQAYLRSSGEYFHVYTSNGEQAIEGYNMADSAVPDGEWVIKIAHLQAVSKHLGGERTALFRLDAAKIQEAEILDPEAGRLLTVQFHHVELGKQPFLPGIDKIFQLPRASRVQACMTLAASKLATLKKLASAAGRDAVDIYLPKEAHQPVCFRVDADTRWTAVIMPVLGHIEGDQTVSADMRQEDALASLFDQVEL